MSLVARFHGVVDAVGGVDGGDCGEGTGDVFFSFHLLGAALVFGGGADVGGGFGGAVVFFVFLAAAAAVALAADFALIVTSCDLRVAAATIAASAIPITVLDVSSWFVAGWGTVIVVACGC